MLFDGHDCSDVLLEVSQMAHEDFLFFDKIVNILGVFLQDTLFLIRTRNLDVIVIVLKNSVGSRLRDALESVIDLGLTCHFWAQENLEFGCLREVVSRADFEKELIQEVHSLQHEIILFVSRSLLRRQWWEVDARVPLIQNLT